MFRSKDELVNEKINFEQGLGVKINYVNEYISAVFRSKDELVNE